MKTTTTTTTIFKAKEIRSFGSSGILIDGILDDELYDIDSLQEIMFKLNQKGLKYKILFETEENGYTGDNKDEWYITIKK